MDKVWISVKGGVCLRCMCVYKYISMTEFSYKRGVVRLGRRGECIVVAYLCRYKINRFCNF